MAVTPQPRTDTPSPRRPDRRRLLALLLVVLVGLGLAACGSSGGSAGGDPTGSAGHTEAAATPRAVDDSAYPVTVKSGPLQGGTPLTIEARPTSIVSLSPTATESLWAIGAADQVVAVDRQSNYPDGVPTTDLSGYEPNVEAILAKSPDLVVAPSDSGDLVASLAKAGVPTLILPAATTIDEAYSQIERLGVATGHPAEATTLVGQMQQQIKAAVAKAPPAQGLTYFHELDPTLFTVSGNTFIGEVYGLFGMTSIADQAKGGDDYPKLSAEFVVDADPDVVMLADTECCGMTVKKAGQRAGWEQMTAVREHHVFVLDKDISSRWGPRLVDFVRKIGSTLDEVAPAGSAAR